MPADLCRYSRLMNIITISNFTRTVDFRSKSSLSMMESLLANFSHSPLEQVVKVDQMTEVTIQASGREV